MKLSFRHLRVDKVKPLRQGEVIRGKSPQIEGEGPGDTEEHPGQPDLSLMEIEILNKKHGLSEVSVAPLLGGATKKGKNANRSKRQKDDNRA